MGWTVQVMGLGRSGALRLGLLRTVGWGRVVGAGEAAQKAERAENWGYLAVLVGMDQASFPMQLLTPY